MDDAKRTALIAAGWEMHAAVEESALKAGSDPVERRRLLLADMAIHLLQTAIRPGEIELDQLRNNLHAILTLADPFLPQAALKEASHRVLTPYHDLPLSSGDDSGQEDLTVHATHWHDRSLR